jgi:hypothetical protein
MTCRFCGAPLRRKFVDLGRAPLSNACLTAEQLRLPEPHYPLCAYVCEECLLVQIEEVVSAEQIFGEYLYFSSYSDAWLRHADAYAKRMTDELRLNAQSLVVEVASNDGYLLQYFRQRMLPLSRSAKGLRPRLPSSVSRQHAGLRSAARLI